MIDRKIDTWQRKLVSFVNLLLFPILSATPSNIVHHSQASLTLSAITKVREAMRGEERRGGEGRRGEERR